MVDIIIITEKQVPSIGEIQFSGVACIKSKLILKRNYHKHGTLNAVQYMHDMHMQMLLCTNRIDKRLKKTVVDLIS